LAVGAFLMENFDVGDSASRGNRHTVAALAAASGRTKTYYAREASIEHPGDLEDRDLAEQRLAKLRSGKGHAWSLDDLERQHGVAD
jgi:RHH-type transcriptional regulator, rel operon repressor / antitoxin RelB